MINKLSRKWSENTKNLVNNSKLNLLRVYDNTYIDSDSTDVLHEHSLSVTEHCDFCGQRIKYVSVLEFDKNTDMLYFQIGKECMSFLFDYGMKINGLEHAKFQIESAVKKLMKQSSERARAEKYKNEFAEYIEWLDSLSQDFIEGNSFIRFINRRLKTGDGIITENMISSLTRLIKRYTPEKVAVLDKTKQTLLEKMDSLLNMMEIVVKDFETASSYKFVKSVREYINKNGNATKKQLDAVNNINDRIKREKSRMTKSILNPVVENQEVIPW